MAGSPRSIWNRKRDLTYFVFFAIHAPLILGIVALEGLCIANTDTVDTYPFLPPFLQADFIFQLRQFYVDTYNDKFFQGTPAPWFSVFNWMELLYHAPLSLWAIGALLRGR